MKDFIILMCSVGAHILSSKGIALGLILLLFWIKGKQLGFNSEKWENYFLELSQKKVLRLTLGVSGIGIVGATLLSYMILNKTGFDYALMIAVIMLCCSVLWFWHKWKGEKGRDYVLKRFAEIPQTILGSLIQLVGPQLGGHFIGNFDIFIMGVPRVKVLQIDSSHYIFLRSDFCCGWTI